MSKRTPDSPSFRGPLRSAGARARLALLLAVSACAGAFALCGAAQAHSIGAAPGRTPGASQEVAQSPPRTCVIHSLSSFVAQGEFGATATVADVVEVECNPMIFGTGSKIKITASQLFSLCKGSLTWYV